MSNNINIDLSHWNYFLALEDDLNKISRFVEFVPENYNAFSIELAHLLLATASEVDVIAKQLCGLIDPSQPAGNIDQYRLIIKRYFNEIANIRIKIPRYNLEFIPWKEWANDINPKWWSDHNKVKHERDKNFERANLENVLNSIAGLFILLMFFYKQQSVDIRLIPVPNLITASRELVKKDLFLGGGICLHFKE